MYSRTFKTGLSQYSDAGDFQDKHDNVLGHLLLQFKDGAKCVGSLLDSHVVRLLLKEPVTVLTVGKKVEHIDEQETSQDQQGAVEEVAEDTNIDSGFYRFVLVLLVSRICDT